MMLLRHNTAWSIVIALICATMLTSQERVAASEEQKIANETNLLERFGEQQFTPEGGFILRQGQELPSLVWEHPDRVATVVNDPKIPTRWFNERFEEVRVAQEPGRYYAYGEAPVPAGPVLRRAMTCCCVDKKLDLKALAQTQVNDPNQPE